MTASTKELTDQLLDEPTLLNGGRWRHAAARFDVRNPATNEVIGRSDDADESDARRAVDAAAAALPTWRATSPRQRALVLTTTANAIRDDLDQLAELLTRECGKPLPEARGELVSAAAAVEWAAEEARRISGRIVDIGDGRRGVVVKQPVGVTVAVSPWNFPASMFLRKIALALAAGCTVIAKPAEQTPLIARRLIERLVAAGCPDGAIELLTTSRPEPVVRALLADPRVAKLSFTGSTDVGLSLLRREGGRLKRVALELGGHAPVIVLDDADIDVAVAGVVGSKFKNSGQSCVAANRLYLHRSIADEFSAALISAVGRLRVGRGDDARVDIGPLIDEGAMAKLQSQVDDARREGARVLLGGSRASDGELAHGCFYPATLLADVADGSSLSTQEIFGPVLPIFVFDDEDEVIQRANATDYGLAAYVYSRDVQRAWRVAERLDFGVIGVNDPFPVAAELPFGGMKNSGLGREGGPEGIEGFLETKAVTLRG